MHVVLPLLVFLVSPLYMTSKEFQQRATFSFFPPPGFWRIRAGVWRIDDEFVATATNVRRDLSAVDFVREDEQEQ